MNIYEKIYLDLCLEDANQFNITIIKQILKEILQKNYTSVISHRDNFELQKLIIKAGNKKYIENYQIKYEINQQEKNKKQLNISILKQDGNTSNFSEIKHKDIYLETISKTELTKELTKFLKF